MLQPLPAPVPHHLAKFLSIPAPDWGTGGTGFSPRAWGHRVGVQDPERLLSRKFSRDGLRRYCQRPNVPVLHKYCAVMAWGEQGKNRFMLRHARSAWEERERIKPLLIRLRDMRDRVTAYDLFRNANIKGLGPSFWTKLLMFIPRWDGMIIMDRYVAEAVHLLYDEKVVRLAPSPTRENTAADYARFCHLVEDLARRTGAKSLHAMEERLFSQPRTGTWRRYVNAETAALGKAPKKPVAGRRTRASVQLTR